VLTPFAFPPSSSFFFLLYDESTGSSGPLGDGHGGFIPSLGTSGSPAAHWYGGSCPP